MKKCKIIGMGMLMGLLVFAGCGNGEKVNVKEERIRGVVRPILKKLEKLGVDYTELEDVLINDLSGFPDDILADNPERLLTGTMFTYLGNKEYLASKGVDAKQLNKLYSFDLEVFDIERMYTNFLNEVMGLSQGELVFSVVSEDFSSADMDSGTGTVMVRFDYNGKNYEYPAKFYYDWFDPEIVRFINQVLAEHHSEKYLYGMSDGYQGLILFYATEEWTAEFNREFGPEYELSK